jgi:hypothetical protein
MSNELKDIETAIDRAVNNDARRNDCKKGHH